MLSYRRKLTFIFTFLSFIFIQKNNAEGIFTNSKSKDLPFTYNLLYYKKNSNHLDLNLASEEFKKMPESNSLGFLNGSYWFQLTVNEAAEHKKIIAYIPTHHIRKIDIYKLTNLKLERISSSGNSLLQNQLLVDYKFPAFKINTANKSVYYLKVDFPKEANFPIKFIPEKNFISFILNKQMINSFYYGIAIIMILLNLFFFFKFKDKTYLYYLLFLTSLMVNFLLWDGSFINLFRNNSNYYNLEFFIHISNEIWFLLFSIKFLNLDKRHPLITKVFYIFPVLVLTAYICYSISNKFIFIAIGDAIGISLFPVLWIFGIYYIKKIPYAKFYVLGYLLIVPFALFFVIGYPFGFWEVHGNMDIVKIASWLDIIVFTYAISYRMKTIMIEGELHITALKNSIETGQLSTEMKPNKSLVDPYLILLQPNELLNKPLTIRELEVLKYLKKGDTNTIISKKLFISPNTLKSHVRNIYAKTNSKNRKELKEKIIELIY